MRMPRGENCWQIWSRTVGCYDGDGSVDDAYRKRMTGHSESPGKEPLLKTACHKSACFCQHIVLQKRTDCWF